MSWAQRVRRREHLRGSLWFVPLICAIVGPPLALLCVALGRGIALPEQLQYSAQTASTVLAAIVAAMVALTGFVVTIGVLIVQMATSTLSPRFMRLEAAVERAVTDAPSRAFASRADREGIGGAAGNAAIPS